MLTEGQILEDKYRVGRLLGQGGMGAVHLGENMRIKRTVAIKTLHDVRPGSDSAIRFEKEAQAAGQIGSDHIVEVLDLGTTATGDRFMVMEYLDGESLKERLSRGRLTPAQVVPLISQALDGLAAAHIAGIIHRDLKPDNVFILKEKAGRRDFVKIVDFGISKFNSLEGGMTKTGAVMGTPYYMSPEQACAAGDVDNRSDLYAVGVLLYEAVTGVKPFTGETFTELVFKIVFEEPPHPHSVVPDLDAGFASIICKAMARDPGERYQSAIEMRDALLGWQPGAQALPPPVALARSQPRRDPPTVPMPTMAMEGPPSSQMQTQQRHFVPAAMVVPWQAQQALGQSVSAGSQVIDATRAPKKSQAGVVVAAVALVVLALGGGALFMLKRSSTSAPEVAAPPVVVTPVPSAAAPAATATATATAAPTTTAEASARGSAEAPVAAAPSSQRAFGAVPATAPPPAKTTASSAPSAGKPKGSVKDLGY